MNWSAFDGQPEIVKVVASNCLTALSNNDGNLTLRKLRDAMFSKYRRLVPHAVELLAEAGAVTVTHDTDRIGNRRTLVALTFEWAVA